MPIKYEKRDGVAYITLNNPEKANILDKPTSDAISEAWTDLWEDRDIRCAILTGEGNRHFCGGHNLAPWPDLTDDDREYLRTQFWRFVHEMMTRAAHHRDLGSRESFADAAQVPAPVDGPVRVALHHRQAARQAGADAVGRQLQPLAVDILLAGQQLQQLPAAAADVEHARAGPHEAQDLAEVVAQGSAHARPRFSALESRKPRRAESRAGSSSRKASWPLSLSISTKLARAPAAFSARTMCRLSVVG